MLWQLIVEVAWLQNSGKPVLLSGVTCQWQPRRPPWGPGEGGGSGGAQEEY